jgi:UDP-N-acetylglucosamine 1-carboxyvinyltransferase
MERIRIVGNPSLQLKGKVKISGAKNAVLPAITASLLTKEKVRLKNIPLVKDVFTILTVMKELGANYSLRKNTLSMS